jgi:hypothetical protein
LALQLPVAGGLGGCGGGDGGWGGDGGEGGEGGLMQLTPQMKWFWMVFMLSLEPPFGQP